MITIGRLAKRFNLARSTLLYYDSIGILCPAERTSNGYRRYSEIDVQRLGKICLYRRAGLSLKRICLILEAKDDCFSSVLEQRLQQINNEASKLQDQQRLVLAMLRQTPPKQDREDPISDRMDRHVWSDLLAASGFTDDDMRKWHIAFERNSPEKHQVFLEFLGVEEDEIVEIRSFA